MKLSDERKNQELMSLNPFKILEAVSAVYIADKRQSSPVVEDLDETQFCSKELRLLNYQRGSVMYAGSIRRPVRKDGRLRADVPGRASGVVVQFSI